METPDSLRAKAARYRTLRDSVTAKHVLDALTALADEYDAVAAKLERAASQNSCD